MKLTQEDLIVKYLRSVTGWIPSYQLEKVELFGQWIGTRGTRTARELAEAKKIEVMKGKDLMNKGVYVDALGKNVKSVYSYYKAVAPKGVKTLTLSNGEVIKQMVWS